MCSAFHRALIAALAAIAAMVAAVPAAAQATDCGTGPLAGDRVALLVGNGDYDGFSWDVLNNSANDVAHICKTLEASGYAVRVLRDAGHNALTTGLNQFAAETRGAKMVVFYYSGHGFQYDQRNYLVPPDAPPVTRRSDLPLRYVALETVAERIIPEGAAALFLIDACRTAAPVVRLEDLPGVASQGTVGPVGLLSLPRGAVLYSTALGAPAYDDAPIGSNLSPFAAAAGQYLSMPVPLPALFGAIEMDVPERTAKMPKGAQEPFHYGRRMTDLFLVEPAKLTAPRTRTGAIRGTPAEIPPLDLPLSRLAVEDEPVVVAKLLATRSTQDIAALAARRDPVAQHILGYMLAFGVGVAKDEAAARRWLKQSSDAGYAPGQLEYGYHLLAHPESEADRVEAERLYRLAAASSYAKAKTHLAFQLINGGFGKADLAAGRAMMVEAAEAGHPAAMFNAAFYGDKPAEMRARLRAVADSGNVEGNLWLCELGFAASRLAESFADCAVAARRSIAGNSDPTALTAHANAMAIVAVGYQLGQGVAADPVQARHWAQRARNSEGLRTDLRAYLDAVVGP